MKQPLPDQMGQQGTTKTKWEIECEHGKIGKQRPTTLVILDLQGFNIIPQKTIIQHLRGDSKNMVTPTTDNLNL